MVVQIKVSKNYYLGAAIRSIKEVYDLSNQHKSIIIVHAGKYSQDEDRYEMKPAAWVINWQARRLQRYVEVGILHYCVKLEDF